MLRRSMGEEGQRCLVDSRALSSTFLRSITMARVERNACDARMAVKAVERKAVVA